MATIHFLYAKYFDMQLESLIKSGKKGKMAATQCAEILEIIRKEGFCSRNLLRKRTKRGEYRLKSCCKYTLGNGYRLITVCRDALLFICFIGTHDDADKWLEQHRFSSFTRASFSITREEFCCCHHQPGQPEEPEQEQSIFADEYEEKLQSRLTDDILRSVFSGLVN